MNLPSTPAPTSKPESNQKNNKSVKDKRLQIGNKSRDQIVEVASKLFGKYGFEGTSLGQIAQAAGLSKAGLPHHFHSKDELVGKVLEHRDIVDESRIGIRETGFDILDDLVELARQNTTNQPIVSLYSTMTACANQADHPAFPWLKQHFSHTLEQIIRALRYGQTHGTIKVDAPIETIARTTVAIMDGIQIQWLIRNQQENTESAFPKDLDSDLAAYVCLVKQAYSA